MDVGIMANAEGYRRLAREALETANTVSSEEARAGLIEMAGAWTRLADKLAGDVPSKTDEPEPAPQPQEQVQPTTDSDTEYGLGGSLRPQCQCEGGCL